MHSNKELFKRNVWQGIYSICSIGFGVLALFGLDRLIGYSGAILLFFPFLFLWIFSIIKTKEFRHEDLREDLIKLLEKEEFQNLSHSQHYDIIKLFDKTKD